MWFQHRAWIPVAWLLSLVNVGAVWFAAAPAEPLHATVHAALGVGFALGARHLMTRQPRATRAEQLPPSSDQSEQLHQTIDGLQGQMQELEERLDFTERLLAQQREAIAAAQRRPES